MKIEEEDPKITIQSSELLDGLGCAGPENNATAIDALDAMGGDYYGSNGPNT